MVDANVDGVRGAGDAIVSRRPPSRPMRRRPENVYKNNASWELDAFCSRLLKKYEATKWGGDWASLFVAYALPVELPVLRATDNTPRA